MELAERAYTNVHAYYIYSSLALKMASDSQATYSDVSSLNNPQNVSQQVDQDKIEHVDVIGDLETQATLASTSEEGDFSSQLPPTRIQRKYECKLCNVETFNPRQHLRHKQQVHGEKVRIVECPKCQYACQYKQKLNRHMHLIHRREARVPSKVQARASRTNERRPKKSIISSSPITSFNFFGYWPDPLSMVEPLDLSLPKERCS